MDLLVVVHVGDDTGVALDEHVVLAGLPRRHEAGELLGCVLPFGERGDADTVRVLEGCSTLRPFRRLGAADSAFVPFIDGAGPERRPGFDGRVLAGDEVVTDATLAEAGHPIRHDTALAEPIEELQHLFAFLDEHRLVAVVEQLAAGLVEELLETEHGLAGPCEREPGLVAL